MATMLAFWWNLGWSDEAVIVAQPQRASDGSQRLNLRHPARGCILIWRLFTSSVDADTSVVIAPLDGRVF